MSHRLLDILRGALVLVKCEEIVGIKGKDVAPLYMLLRLVVTVSVVVMMVVSIM